MFSSTAQFFDWLARRRESYEYEVTRVPLGNMPGWQVRPDSGDVVHRTGKFFSVRGLEVSTDHRDTRQWAQPIIVQPEIGILGIAVRVVDGEIHCLMQAKMEPGNVNLLQLSPTVQATRSNYTRVHRGNPVPYLEHFVAPRDGGVVFDALQSEQGSWFLHKRNRNMIVEVTGDPPAHDDFCWLSLSLIAELMRVPNLINMDARTVLSGMPFISGLSSGWPAQWRVPFDGSGPPVHGIEHLLSWFTEVKSRYQLTRRMLPMNEVPHWRQVSGEIRHAEGRYFSVIGVDVRAGSREVAQWSQPMLRPSGRGVIGFLATRFGGVLHVLVQARTEAGTQDVVEMSPTVNCIPANYEGLPAESRPMFLDDIENADSGTILVDVVHSEEGGRFFHAENRYVVVDIGADRELDVPEDFCWMTVDQLTAFVRYGNYVNVAARCLLSCMLGETLSPLTVPA